jgi:nitrite reductase (NO-forming)
MASVEIAALFLALAAVAAVTGRADGGPASPWLPLHLALAGGASTAIAGVMPFFVAALAAGHPAPARVRAAAVVLIATGALLVSVRAIAPSSASVAGLGGLVFLAGVACLAVATRQAGRAGLMVRRPIVSLGYYAALANLAVGASLGTLAAMGAAPVLERWAVLRPAHAWANLIGFVSVVIVATLLHFLPTVFGTRIVPRHAPVTAVLAPALGVPLVVASLVLGLPVVAAGGAVVVLVGAIALAFESVATARVRGRWTTDYAWHLTAELGLVAGVAWYVVGIGLATGRLVAFAAGAAPDGWSTPLVAAPLAVGWVIQVLIASWTHLLPSIGPGDPPAHARQRPVLGRGAVPRLLALNAGTALLALGWPTGSTHAAAAGLVLAATAVLSSVILGGLAIRESR